MRLWPASSVLSVLSVSLQTAYRIAAGTYHEKATQSAIHWKKAFKTDLTGKVPADTWSSEVEQLASTPARKLMYEQWDLIGYCAISTLIRVTMLMTGLIDSQSKHIAAQQRF